MARTEFAFHHRFRVRWSETDAQGVVFNARYLDYADVAPLEFHVKKATVTWFAPIKPDELIDVMARTVATGRTSMTQIVEIHGITEDGSDDLRATVDLVSVHVDLDTHRPIPLPHWVKDVFLNFDQQAATPAVAMADA
jgi:acyl-CoA thioester hydrolase